MIWFNVPLGHILGHKSQMSISRKSIALILKPNSQQPSEIHNENSEKDSTTSS